MVHSFIQNIGKNKKVPLYGAKRVIIATTINFSALLGKNILSVGQSYAYPNTIAPLEFPVINGKSPAYLTVPDTITTDEYLRVVILELGGVPSDDYWDL